MQKYLDIERINANVWIYGQHMYLDIQSVNINIWDIQREGQHENLKGGHQKL